MKKKLFLLLLVIMVFLSSCQTATPQLDMTASIQNTGEPVVTSAADKATVAGRILSVDGKVPYDNLVIRLARVYRTGEAAAFALDMGSSPGDFTDSDGVFIITNVTEAEYVVFIGDPDGTHIVISDDENNATVYQAKAGETLTIGDLKVDYQP